MHVHVEEMPQKENPAQIKKRKYKLYALTIGVILCIGVGIFLLFSAPQPKPVETNITPPTPGYKINFSYELGIIPASFDQHVVKITHTGGETIDDMNESLWITIYPPESTPYLRRTLVRYNSKYLDLSEGDELYIYIGRDQLFYASKELPDFEEYIDFPVGKWGIHIDDSRYKTGISTYEFNIDTSKTHLISKGSRIQTEIDNAKPFDTLIVKGKDNVYHEQLTIENKPLRLYGVESPIIDAGGSNSVITLVNTSYCEIYGFEIINSGIKEPIDAGILVYYSDHISIRNNSIHNNQNGIYLLGSLNNDILYNQAYLNDIAGLLLAQDSNSNTIKENSFQLNTMGIYIKDASTGNYMVKNTGHGNTRYGILIDNKLKNIYEYNDFTYDKMSYDRSIDENLTSSSLDNVEDIGGTWMSTCGKRESPYSPACIGKKASEDY